MDRDEALEICDEYFPDGLERLVKELSVRVERTDLGDVDGWCYQLPDGGRVVRLSTDATKERQRFTLAHELAHFILGSRPRTMALFWDVFNPRSPEERKADDLASRLLLPTRRVPENIDQYAIDYSAIKKLIKRARVSDIVVALRLAKSNNEFGLDRPTVVRFDDHKQINGVVPQRRTVSTELVFSLFDEASASQDRTAVRPATDGTVIIASVLPNPKYPTLFFYHAAPQAARRSPKLKELKELEEALFADDDAFRRCLNGCIGGNKRTLLPLGVMDRVDFIIEKFLGSYTQRSAGHIEKINSQECYEYLWLRMEEL